MKTFRLTILTLLLICAAHVSISAQDTGPNEAGSDTKTSQPPPLPQLSTSHFFSVGGRVGVVIPHGEVNDFFDPNIAATADLEYHATDQFSIAGLFGYRRFSSSFSDHANLYQISAGPKLYLTSDSTRPFVNGGVGAFVDDTGTARFGLHLGGGLQFQVSPKVFLEGEYQFHNVFVEGTNFKFSTVQGGVRFRF